jgi:uncharacterized protein YndB with AHSA1/START domain
MAHAERTLIQSPPELWELVDDDELMRRWSEELLGAAGAEIEVTRRSPGEALEWRPAGDASATIELMLAEKGFGTNVTIEARRSDGGEPAADTLEELLDELSSPQKRPFARG